MPDPQTEEQPQQPEQPEQPKEKEAQPINPNHDGEAEPDQFDGDMEPDDVDLHAGDEGIDDAERQLEADRNDEGERTPAPEHVVDRKSDDDIDEE